MTLINPIGYKIEIKQVGDKYHLDYIEYFDKNIEEHREAFNNMIADVEKMNSAIQPMGMHITAVNPDDFSVHLVLDGTLEDIADAIVGEFALVGHFAKLTMGDIFELLVRKATGI